MRKIFFMMNNLCNKKTFLRFRKAFIIFNVCYKLMSCIFYFFRIMLVFENKGKENSYNK